MGLVNSLLGQRVYLDANVFLYAVNGVEPFDGPLAELFAAIDRERVTGVTSELTVAEILVTAFQKADAGQEMKCRTAIQPRPGLKRLPIDLEILEASARLRAATPALRTPDAIHAATARISGCEFFLTNDHRLKGLPDLQVILLSEAVSR